VDAGRHSGGTRADVSCAAVADHLCATGSGAGVGRGSVAVHDSDVPARAPLLLAAVVLGAAAAVDCDVLPARDYAFGHRLLAGIRRHVEGPRYRGGEATIQVKH